MLRAAVALVLTLLGSGCVRPSNRDVAWITVVGGVCAACSDGFVIGRDGTIEELGQSAPRVFDRRLADAAIASVPLDELGLTRRMEIAVPTSLAIVAVSYRDGRVERAAVPLADVDVPVARRLQRWTQTFSWRATVALTGDRYRALEAAFQRDAVRRLTLEALGCLGTCATYTASFASSGIATYRDRARECETSASAFVPFQRVVDAALAGGALRLRPTYASRAVDTFGARITIVTRRRVFVSYAPDRTTWGPEFTATQSRLDQIVRDARWSPPLGPPPRLLVGGGCGQRERRHAEVP